MKKKHIQSCDLSGNIYGKKRTTSKSTRTGKNSVNKKELVRVYNKFYKDQVTALYKAINSGK